MLMEFKSRFEQFVTERSKIIDSETRKEMNIVKEHQTDSWDATSKFREIIQGNGT